MIPRWGTRTRERLISWLTREAASGVGSARLGVGDELGAALTWAADST